MSQFDELIKELGAQMGVPLRVDAHHSCKLSFADGVFIQIDHTTSGENIVMGSELGILTPGPYRDRMLKTALTVNGLPLGEKGVLAYSEKNESLVLFQFFPIGQLNGQKLYQFLQQFYEHALVWIAAIRKGDVPELQVEKK